MKVLFSLQPATGHLQPVSSIAAALQELGHEVLFSSSQSFQPIVEKFGFRSVPIGIDWLRGNSVASFPELGGLPSERHYDWILREVYAGRALGASLHPLEELVSEWQPDLIVRDQVEFASWLVAEKLDVPHVSFGYGLGFQEVDRTRIQHSLNQRAETMGLGCDASVESLFRYPRLEFAPKSYLPPDAPDVPDRWHVRYETSDDKLFGKQVDVPKFGNDLPTVLLTLGTNYNRQRAIFNDAIDALDGKPVNLLVTLGRAPFPDEFRKVPENVRLVETLPLSRILQDVDAIICHAGFNTMMTAALSSVPMLLLPIDSDQPAQAMRGEALGFGVCLDPGKPAVEEIPRQLQRLIEGPDYAAAVGKFQREIKALPGPHETAERLQSWVSGSASERRFRVAVG